MPRTVWWMNNTPEAVKALTENILDVYFIKRSTGTLRRMHCTLNLEHIPYDQRGTAAGIINSSGYVDTSNMPLPVWDIFMGGWRSFYLDSIQNSIPSVVVDDALEKVREMANEQIGELEETEGLAEKEGFIEGIVASVVNQITQGVEEAPEKLVDFSISKIKDFIIRSMAGFRR
jgi:hypothetical protein